MRGRDTPSENCTISLPAPSGAQEDSISALISIGAQAGGGRGKAKGKANRKSNLLSNSLDTYANQTGVTWRPDRKDVYASVAFVLQQHIATSGKYLLVASSPPLAATLSAAPTAVPSPDQSAPEESPEATTTPPEPPAAWIAPVAAVGAAALLALVGCLCFQLARRRLPS